MVDNMTSRPLLDRLLAFLSLGVSFVALYFAWQANQIASKNVTSNISLLDSYSSLERRELFDKGMAHCGSRITLVNRGGAPTDLVYVQATLAYADKQISFRVDTGSYGSWGSNLLDAPPDSSGNEPHTDMHLVTDLGYPDYPNSLYNQKYVRRLPIRVAAYETTLVYIETLIPFNPVNYIYLTEQEIGTTTNDSSYVRIGYRLITASGELIEIPSVSCFELTKK